jgi:hypothetical protein
MTKATTGGKSGSAPSGAKKPAGGSNSDANKVTSGLSGGGSKGGSK